MSTPPGVPYRPKSTSRRLAGHVVVLSSGVALQRVIALFAQIVIARAVGPSALGAYAIALALVVASSVFTDGGLTTLTVRRIVREPHRVNHLVSVTLAAQLLLAVLGLIVLDVVALAGPWTGSTTLLIIALTPGLLFSALNMSYVFTASELMGHVAAYRAVASIVPSIGSMILVVITKDTLWVAISNNVGLILASALVYLRLRRRLGIRLERVRSREIRRVVRDGLPLFGSGALLIIPPTSVTIIVALVLGNRAAGIYSAAWQLSIAAVTIGPLIVEAIYPEMVRRWDAGRAQLSEFVAAMLRLLCRLLFPPTVAVVFAAAPITRLLFGANFDATAPVLRVLVLVVPLGFFWVILGQGLTAADGEATLFRRTFVITVLTLVAVPVAAEVGGLVAVTWTVVALAALQVALYSSGPLGNPGFAARVALLELPYAALPAALCLLALLVGLGNGLLVDVVAAVVGVLGWELVRGWPTLKGLRALVTPQEQLKGT